MIIQQTQHNNPCRQKVPYPILKNSQANYSSLSQVNSQNNLIILSRKQSCPQILKIRNNKSTSDIACFQINGNQGNVDDGIYNCYTARNRNQGNKQFKVKEEFQDQESDRSVKYQKSSSKKGINKQLEGIDQNIRTYDNTKLKKVKRTVGQFVKKKSVNTILGSHTERQKVNVQISECQRVQPQPANQIPSPPPDLIDTILLQHNNLTLQLQSKQAQLSKTQSQYFKLQQKYIRLLEVSNQRSQSQIKILMDSNQSRIKKSKIRNSTVSEKASRLKAKLESLDISVIGNSKESSFKICQAI